MILDIISTLCFIVLVYLVNKVTDELEIKRLIKVGKEMEKKVIVDIVDIVDVEYEVIID